MARFRLFSLRRPARWATSIVAYAAAIGVLAVAHDYPQTIRAISEQRADPYGRRPWLPFFYFVNEAGSGIKYELTGDPRHFRHFPSSRYFRDRFYRDKEGAENGALASQLRLGYYYMRGSGVARDYQRAAFWASVAALRGRDGKSLSDNGASNLRNIRAGIAQVLPPQKIAQAERDAAAWLAARESAPAPRR